MQRCANLKLILVSYFLISTIAAPVVNAATNLNGSGASFPFPLYSKWFKDFSKIDSDTRVDYQAKGSGAGIQDFTNGVVDFAGSDAAMSDDEIANAKQGVVLLPVTAGEIVLTYNLPAIKTLNLPRSVYPDIFAGKIAKWNDPRIVAANPRVTLPDQNIRVVVRSDSSGTSYVFTGHLAAISSTFKSEIGQDKAPQWPNNSNIVKAPKNDGVTATVKQTPGAIGYIEYGYAKLTGSPVALLENKAGKYISPGPDGGAAALASTVFPTGSLPGSSVPDLRGWNYDPAGDTAYPIASFTWLLFPPKMSGEKMKAAQKLIEYCITVGQKSADEMGYIPLPQNVVEMTRTAAASIK